MKPPQRARRKVKDPVLERKIAEIQRQHGLDKGLAAQVATGRTDLNAVLRRLALSAEVESLMRRHDLSRALATQISMRQADLDAVLRKRRMSEHLTENKSRSVLEEAHASGASIAVGLHGNRVFEGKVTHTDRYEVTLQPNKGDAEVVHKLQFKFACDVKSRKKARRALRFDKALKDSPKEPIWKPQERYTCSNRRLFSYLDQETLVQATLLEGEVFKGTVSWVGRFEFGLQLKGNAELVVFRHALADLRPA